MAARALTKLLYGLEFVFRFVFEFRFVFKSTFSILDTKRWMGKEIVVEINPLFMLSPALLC